MKLKGDTILSPQMNKKNLQSIHAFPPQCCQEVSIQWQLVTLFQPVTCKLSTLSSPPHPSRPGCLTSNHQSRSQKWSRSGHWAHCDSLVMADYLQRSKVNLLRPSIWKRGHHISAYNFPYYRSYFFILSTSNRSLSLGRLILSLVILSTLAVWQPFPGKLPPMLH